MSAGMKNIPLNKWDRAGTYGRATMLNSAALVRCQRCKLKFNKVVLESTYGLG